MTVSLAQRLALAVGALIVLGGVVLSLLIPRTVNLEFEQFMTETSADLPPIEVLLGALESLESDWSVDGEAALAVATPPPGHRFLVRFDDGRHLVDQGPAPAGLDFDSDANRLTVMTSGPGDNHVVLTGLPSARLQGLVEATAWLVPESVLLAPEDQFRHAVQIRIWLLIGAFVVLAVTLVGVVVHRSTRPIRTLNDAMRGIGEGPLPEPLAVQRQDEIGQLTRTFNQALARLERLHQHRRQMTSDIAHELRTPLNNLRGQLEGIEEGLFPLDGQRLQVLVAEIGLLTRIVDDLQQLSLAEAGELDIRPESVPLAPFLEGVRDAWQPRVATVGGQIEVAATTDLTVTADPERLRQVLNILIDNACVHGGEAVVIELSVRQVETRGCIRVQDSGPGIDPSHRGRIFERLYRVDTARARDTGGAGLGLALAMELTRQQSGQLDCVDTGRGACFELCFALSPESVP